ncbi:MAG: PmoA family protein [Acidobacteriia bacterium]|nr:PmoA family protein [Terriglobia bacterium]
MARTTLAASTLVFPVLLVLSSSICAGESVDLKRSDHQIDVLIGGKPFTTFYFDPKVPKPYLHPLRSAEGIVVTRGFPMRKDIPGESTDHPHHRGMYFAHGDVNGIDFWTEAEFEENAPVQVGSRTYQASEHLPHGRTVFTKLEEVKSGRDAGSLRADFNLAGPDGKVIAEETQAYTFRGDAATRTIDCEFILRALGTPVKMGDTKEGTFAIRVVKALEESSGMKMTDSAGRVGEKEIWGKRANWVDYSGTVEGKKLGLAIFDNPSNPKHPTYWHARGYGLFAVNPFGERDFYNDPKRDGSLTIPPGGSLTFRYRVLIHEGDTTEAKVAEAYSRYVSGK